MNLADFRRRRALNLVTRWTAPKPGEPAHGFVMRLAALHHEVSAMSFVSRMGVTSVEVPEHYIDALAGSALARPEHLAALRAWTPRFPPDGEGAGELAGQAIRRQDWSLATRRFCPGCLAEDAYHRSWFDLTFFGFCPFHGLPLTDVYSGGIHAYFRSSAIALMPTGARLDHPSPRLVTAPATIERYALGRVGLMEPWVVDLLEEYALWEVVEAADILGRLKFHGWSQATPPQGSAEVSVKAKALGFGVLAGGREAVAALFRHVAAKAPASAHGERRIYGWASADLWKRGGLCGAIHEISGDVAVGLGRQSRRWRRARRGELAERVTMQQVASHFGRSDGVITSIVTNLGLMLPHEGGSGRSYMMESRHLDQVKEFLSDTLSRDDAASYLGLDIERFNEVARAGFIEKTGSRWSDKSGSGRATGQVDRFRRQELEAFLDALPLYHPEPRKNKNPNFRAMLSVAEVLNLTGFDAGDFFEAVRAGRLVINTCADGGGGLRDFRIEPRCQPPSEAFTKRCMSVMATRGRRTNNGMSIREACAILEVGGSTVQLLVDQGFIPTLEHEGRAQYRIDIRGVLEFHRRYATGQVWAKALGSSRAKAIPALRKRGIAPAVIPVLPEGRALALFFDRAVVNQALGLRADPESLDSNRIVWKRLAAYLGQVQSSFTIMRIYDHGALLSDAKYEWPMKVRFEFHDMPPCSDHDVFDYGIDIRLLISGKYAPTRIARITEVMKDRELDPAIRVTIGEDGSTLEAQIRIRIRVDRPIDPEYTPDHGIDFVARHGEYSAKVIERAAYTLRGSLEPSDRPFDPRMFGIGFNYVMFEQQYAKAPPLLEPWRSPVIKNGDVRGFRKRRQG